MREITKEEFKKIYFEHPDPEMNAEAVQDYWNHFYENEEGAKYFYEEPPSAEHTRMFIVTDFSDEHKPIHRIFFMTEESEESFFRM